MVKFFTMYKTVYPVVIVQTLYFPLKSDYKDLQGWYNHHSRGSHPGCVQYRSQSVQSTGHLSTRKGFLELHCGRQDSLGTVGYPHKTEKKQPRTFFTLHKKEEIGLLKRCKTQNSRFTEESSLIVQSTAARPSSTIRDLDTGGRSYNKKIFT